MNIERNETTSDANGQETGFDRRRFVGATLTTSGSLLLGSVLPGCRGAHAQMATSTVASGQEADFQSLYLEVTPENRFLMTFDKAEMGQGVITGQATLFGEEADIHPWHFQMRPASADSRYGTMMGHAVTGGSTSTTDRFDVLRRAGAAYRLRVVKAAAKTWGVAEGDVRTENGFVFHDATRKKVPYAQFNAAAATFDAEEIDKAVQLKPREKWQFIGRFDDSIDAEEKVTGAPEFGVDLQLPGMKTAIIVRSPAFGGKLKSADLDSIKALPDVHEAVIISTGVAIVCDTYWRCLRARQQLDASLIQWDNANASVHNSTKLRAQYRDAVVSDAPKADGKVTVSGLYSLPYLVHAPMEPQNGVGWRKGDKLELWLPTQGPTFVKSLAALLTDMDPEKITVHNAKYLGGGFGRRGQLDYPAEIIELAAKVSYPVRVMWSREDDMQHSPMRPMTFHQLHATLGEGKEGESKGMEGLSVERWQHKMTGEYITQDIVAPMAPLLMPSWMPSAVGKGVGSLMKGAMSLTGAAPMTTEGAEQPYNLPYDVEAVEQESKVPVTYWRAVGSSHNGFVVESFLDECAHAMKKDPVAYRLDLLKDNPRATAVVQKAAELSGWVSKTPRAGGAMRALGFAYHYSFFTHVAEVADVEVVGKEIKVHSVTAVVDCGTVVNPMIVKKQIQSGILFGLSTALHNKIDFVDGVVQQTNFDTYPLLRMSETPDVMVHLMDSQEGPTGVGEPGLPPIAAAVGNGVFRATGQRLRELPFQLSESLKG